MAQNSVCSELGWELKKSQAESWAVAACGISLFGMGLTAWMRSGKRMASWMKKTGMLFPTISEELARVYHGRRVAVHTKVAFVGVAVKVSLVSWRVDDLQAGCEAVDVPGRVRAAPGSGNGREADKHGRRLSRSAQKRRCREVAPVGVAGKRPVGSSTASVHHSFGNLWCLSVCCLCCLGQNSPAHGRNAGSSAGR